MERKSFKEKFIFGLLLAITALIFSFAGLVLGYRTAMHEVNNSNCHGTLIIHDEVIDEFVDYVDKLFANYTFNDYIQESLNNAELNFLEDEEIKLKVASSFLKPNYFDSGIHYQSEEGFENENFIYFKYEDLKKMYKKLYNEQLNITNLNIIITSFNVEILCTKENPDGCYIGWNNNKDIKYLTHIESTKNNKVIYSTEDSNGNIYKYVMNFTHQNNRYYLASFSIYEQ